MVLARGYTRAGEFIFDSDDETPVPKPHPYKAAIPQHVRSPPRHYGCISPVKYSWDVSHGTIPFPAGSAPLAGSAQMAKAAAKATSSIQLPIRTGHPPTRVQASNAEVVPPPPPIQPTPAKGCRLHCPPTAAHLLPFPRPPISKGYDHVGDGKLWRNIAVPQHGKNPWPKWGRGVVDLRPVLHSTMVVGRLMRHALRETRRIIKMVACEHKIGMCRCPHERFMMYQEDDRPWLPWLMGLLASTTTREGAWYLEAGLILSLEANSVNMANNINWTRSCDYGGEGPRPEAEAHVQHYVYVAVKPVPPRV